MLYHPGTAVPLLHLFTNPSIVARLERPILTRFLEDYRHCLSPEAVALLNANPPPNHEEFCAAWAEQFKSAHTFAQPLRDALVAIETLARPENQPLLEEPLSHLPPGFEVRRDLPLLNQALHLWVIAQTTPGVSFPLAPSDRPSVAQSSSSSSPTARSSSSENRESMPPSERESVMDKAEMVVPIHEPEQPTNEGDQSKIANQKSKMDLVWTAEPAPQPPAPPQPSASDPSLQSAVTPPPQSPPDDFHRLALLSPVDYDHVRHAEAIRLGLRVSTLDAEVEECRSQLDDAEAENCEIPVIEPWPEPITDAPDLFDQVHGRYLAYCYLPAGASVVLTMFVGHTHAIRAFHYTPRINLFSDEGGCGKTTTVELTQSMAARAILAQSLRPAVVYRLTHKRPLTVLLDELEHFLPLCRELRGLLNAGNRDNATFFRCEGKNVRGYKVFSPVILACVGDLFSTLRSRCIRIHMEQAPEGVTLTEFDPHHLELEHTLARKLARWAADNMDAIAACKPPLPKGARNRVADKWRPLFQIAYVVGGHWPQLVTEAFYALEPTARPSQSAVPHMGSGASAPVALNPGEHKDQPIETADLSTIANQKSKTDALNPDLLLPDIRHVFSNAGVDRMFSRDLVARLIALPDRPWRNLANDKPITVRQLACRLHALGIQPRTLWIANTVGRGYLRTDFSLPLP